jgi:hypothetical protein
MRRSGACSLTFCRGESGPGKREMNWPQKGHIRLRLPKQAGFGGREEHIKGYFFFCVLCVPLWQSRFLVSLLLHLAKGERESRRGIAQVVDFHDFSRYFHCFSLSLLAVWSHSVAPSRTQSNQSHPVAPSRSSQTWQKWKFNQCGVR